MSEWVSECRGIIPYHSWQKPRKKPSQPILSIYLLHHVHDVRLTLVVRVGDLDPGLDDINGVRHAPA